jgi:hypothetical protein
MKKRIILKKIMQILVSIAIVKILFVMTKQVTMKPINV